MRHFLTIMICIAIATAARAQSATDKAEKRLAELLAPGNGAVLTLPVQQITWKAGQAVERLELPIVPFAGLPPRLAPAPNKEAKPSAVAEGVPLVSYQDKTPAPKQVELPTKPLIRLPSLDLHTPLPIPILAQPTKDRASLGDPAFDASLDAAMKRFTPTRDKPVPFTPLDLPDPFEHIRYGQLRNPPSENPMPPVLPLTKPK